MIKKNATFVLKPGPNINRHVTDRNTKLCCQGFVLAIFQSTTLPIKLILKLYEVIHGMQS